jgi:hypothetical protein
VSVSHVPVGSFEIPGNRALNPGETLSFSFKAGHPGAFMYHCGTARP